MTLTTKLTFNFAWIHLIMWYHFFQCVWIQYPRFISGSLYFFHMHILPMWTIKQWIVLFERCSLITATVCAYILNKLKICFHKWMYLQALLYYVFFVYRYTFLMYHILKSRIFSFEFQRTVPIGDAVISTVDTCLGSEICEELWSPDG